MCHLPLMNTVDRLLDCFSDSKNLQKKSTMTRPKGNNDCIFSWCSLNSMRSDTCKEYHIIINKKSTLGEQIFTVWVPLYVFWNSLLMIGNDVHVWRWNGINVVLADRINCVCGRVKLACLRSNEWKSWVIYYQFKFMLKSWDGKLKELQMLEQETFGVGGMLGKRRVACSAQCCNSYDSVHTFFWILLMT